MRIYDKNLNKISLSPKISKKADYLVTWLIDYYQIYSNDDTRMTLTYFTAKSYLFLYAFVWEKDKNDMFVYDIKVGRCSQSNEYMKHYEYQRSMPFIDIHPRSFRFNRFKTSFP